MSDKVRPHISTSLCQSKCCSGSDLTMLIFFVCYFLWKKFLAPILWEKKKEIDIYRLIGCSGSLRCQTWVLFSSYENSREEVSKQRKQDQTASLSLCKVSCCKFKCQQTLEINQIFQETNAPCINSFLVLLDAVYQHVPVKCCHHKRLHLSSHTERTGTQTKGCLQFLNLQPVTSAEKRSPL